MTAGIESQLGVLESAGLIELLETDPELEYLFRHVLVQDAAYDSLLRAERRRLHRIVAETIEERYASRRDELAPVLAMHFEAAGDAERAAPYYAMAGEAALERFANSEARGFFSRARGLLPDSSDPEVRRKRVRLTLKEVEAGLSFVSADTSLGLLAMARPHAEALGEPRLLAELHLAIALERTVRGEQLGASPELAEALDASTRFARTSGDVALEALGKALLGEARYKAGEFRQAAALLDEAIPVLEAAGRISRAAHHGVTLASVYGRLGEFAEAALWVERAGELGRQSRDPVAIADAEIARGLIAALRGDARNAILYADDAAEQSDRIDSKVCSIVARTIAGEQRLTVGDAAGAIPILEEATALALYCNLVPVKVAFGQVLLDSAKARSGGTAPTFERYDEALDLAESTGDRIAVAELLRQRARDRALAGHEWELADRDYEESARVFEVLAARPSLAQTLVERARLLERVGRAEDARAHAERARELFDAMALPELAAAATQAVPSGMSGTRARS